MSRRGNSAPHKATSPGNGRYVLLPHVTLGAILQSGRRRELAVLLAIAKRFDGFNNGRIGISMRDLGTEIGSSDNAANTRAIGWLVEAGFLWIGKTYPKGQRKAREYGLTFITSGTDQNPVTASHAYLETEKPRRWKTQPRPPFRGDVSYTDRKQSGESFHTGDTETSQFGDSPPVLVSHTHIISHTSSVLRGRSDTPEIPPKSGAAKSPSAGMTLEELRGFTLRYLNWAPSGAQSQLAHDAKIPGGTLSKFTNGRGLPDRYRMPLQLAVGRSFPMEKRA